MKSKNMKNKPGYSVTTHIYDVLRATIPSIVKADLVTPTDSQYVARMLGEFMRKKETDKSERRVIHLAKDGRYLGKKYAWRIYGMALSKKVFSEYLDAIGYPSVPCTTLGTQSVAYKEAGLVDAMDKFIDSCTRKGKKRFKSIYLPNKGAFVVRAIKTIMDDKCVQAGLEP